MARDDDRLLRIWSIPTVGTVEGTRYADREAICQNPLVCLFGKQVHSSYVSTTHVYLRSRISCHQYCHKLNLFYEYISSFYIFIPILHVRQETAFCDKKGVINAARSYIKVKYIFSKEGQNLTRINSKSLKTLKHILLVQAAHIKTHKKECLDADSSHIRTGERL